MVAIPIAMSNGHIHPITVVSLFICLAMHLAILLAVHLAVLLAVHLAILLAVH
jgi:hypothetical protein